MDNRQLITSEAEHDRPSKSAFERLGVSAQPTFFVLALPVLIVATLVLTRDYAVPVAVAFLFWFLISELAAQIRRISLAGRRLPYGFSQLLASLALFGTLVLAIRIMVLNATELSGAVAESDSQILFWARTMIWRMGLAEELSTEAAMAHIDLRAVVTQALEIARVALSDTVLVFLYVSFLLIEERIFNAKVAALYPDPVRRARLTQSLSQIAGETRGYLFLMSLLSAGVAVFTFAICFAVGLEGAAFWAFLAFALNFIPTIGSILAVVLPGAFGVLTLDDPALLAALILGLGMVQFTAGEIVLPRLMTDRLNLSSFVILLALVIWGAIWGAAGMFLAIPLTMILAMTCARFPETRPISILLSGNGKLPTVLHHSGS